MFPKPPRALVDVAAFVGIAWMWIAIYQSFTHSGLWPIVDGALTGSATMPGQALELAICVLIGWISLATSLYAVWHVLLRRLNADFPTARLQR